MTATASPALNALNAQNALADVTFEAGTITAEATTPFYAKLTADCPVDAVTFANVTFHKQIEKRLPDGRVMTIPGQLLHISKNQLDLCKKAMSTHCLRIFWERDAETGRLKRRGQQDVQFKRWDYPGVGPDSKPFLGVDGKPRTAPELVAHPGYVPNKNDVAWTKFCRLSPLTPETVATIQMMQGEGELADFMSASTAAGASEHIDASREAGIPAKPLDTVSGPIDVLASARAFNEAEMAKEQQTLGAEAGIASKRRGRGTTAERMD